MNMVSDNWKLALDHPEVITEYLANEVAARCKAGLFSQPPFPDFVGLPVGVVAKKCTFLVKYRIIHDLSWPPQDSVNDHIDLDAFRCFYQSFDDPVALIIKHGVGTLSAKLDLADTFKHILIISQDWPLFGSFWDLQHLDGSMCYLYYMELFLSFGLHSFPAPFNEYADALQYAMKTKCRTCYTIWIITSLLAYCTPQFAPTTSQPWLLHVGNLTLPLIQIRPQNQLQPQTF